MPRNWRLASNHRVSLEADTHSYQCSLQMMIIKPKPIACLQAHERLIPDPQMLWGQRCVNLIHFEIICCTPVDNEYSHQNGPSPTRTSASKISFLLLFFPGFGSLGLGLDKTYILYWHHFPHHHHYLHHHHHHLWELLMCYVLVLHLVVDMHRLS